MIKGVIGCDVSHWQDKIDWSKVETDFAFIKATQGTSFVDSELNNNWKGLKANKIIRGTYHFLDAKTASAGTAEAKHYLSTMAKLGGLKKGDLPLVLDYEGEARPAGARAFVKALKAAGNDKVILYCSASVVPSDLFGADYLWVAQYGPEKKPDAKNWTFWQYSNGVNGAEPQSTPGIGPCDMNKFNGSMKELRTLVGLPTRDDVVDIPPTPPVEEEEEEKKPTLLERLRRAGRLTRYRKRHHGRPQPK